MMKIKTTDLIGAPLDWAVAVALGAKAVKTPEAQRWMLHWPSPLFGDQPRWSMEAKPYSTSGDTVINIMERERIGVTFHDERDDWEVPNWGAWPTQTDDRQEVMGETVRIAVCRCYVTAKLGDEVDIPEELLGAGHENQSGEPPCLKN